MPVPNILRAGPALNRRGQTILWIVGDNLDDVRDVIIEAAGERWRIVGRVSGPVPTTNEMHQKIAVRVVHMRRDRECDQAEDEPHSDDDFAAMTVTITNDVGATTETLEDEALIDGPEGPA